MHPKEPFFFHHTTALPYTSQRSPSHFPAAAHHFTAQPRRDISLPLKWPPCLAALGATAAPYGVHHNELELSYVAQTL